MTALQGAAGGPRRRLRIAISGWGSTGDLMPLVAVGAELRRRGHEVAFVSNPHFSAAAAEANLTSIPIGSVADHQGLLADSNVFGRERRTWEVIYGRHYYPHMPAFYAAVDRLAQQGVDVIVADEVGASCVAERRGIPRARVSPSSVRFASRYDPPHPEAILPARVRWMAGGPRRMALYYRLRYLRHGILRWPSRRRTLPESHPIAAFRASVGLPPQPPDGARLVVGLWPDWFAPPQRDWPANTIAVGFSLYPPPAFDAGDAASSARPIVATTGSVAGSQRGFYDAVVAACRALGRGALLVTPHADHIPPDLPANVTHVAHAPFNEIFGRAALVVHHGGVGTAAYALAAGVPQIVVPMRGDQFDNGNRLVRLGVAALVAIDARRHDEFIATVREMLTSPRVETACRRCQTRLDPGAGLRVAAERIEALAG
jgi:UDP:flavonoid glycosyltransferase YjiC (YdhE family)